MRFDLEPNDRGHTMQRQNIDRRHALSLGAAGATMLAGAAIAGKSAGLTSAMAEEAPESLDATFGDVDAF